MLSESGSLPTLYLESLEMFCLRFLQGLDPGRRLYWNWHHILLCDRLTRVATGEIKRLVVNLPPRTLKSQICSIAFPAWLLARDASLQIMGVSYEEGLALTLARKSREIMRSKFYQAITRTRLSPIRSAVDEFETTQGGRRMARSLAGAITGHGGDISIFDDLVQPEQAFSDAGRERTMQLIQSTLLSRVNSMKDSRLVLVMQRLAVDDPSAYFIEAGWSVLALPMIAIADEEHQFDTALGPQIHRRLPGEVLHPERDSLADVLLFKKGIPDAIWEPQYQQTGVPPGGNIVKLAWFPRFTTAPASFDRIIQAWDTALKAGERNDYSACVTLGLVDDKAYVLDVYRERLEYRDLKRAIVARGTRFGAQVVLIEDAGSGSSVLGDLPREGFPRVQPAPASGEKTMRLIGATGPMAEGTVYLPEAAPWLDAFLTEITSFPNCRYDDQADAFAHAVNWFKVNGCMPGLLRYYRDCNERQRQHKQLRNVRIQTPDKSHRCIILIDGTPLSTDNDGIVSVAEADVAPFLRLGWSRLD